MSHQDAIQRAREIAARLSGKSDTNVAADSSINDDSNGGKRKRWGVMPTGTTATPGEAANQQTKKPKLDTKHIWVSGITKDRPGRHFVLHLKDDLAEMQKEMRSSSDPYVSFSFQGKGSSAEPPLPGVPEEPLHIALEGSVPEVLRTAQSRIQQLLEQAEVAPVHSEALVVTSQTPLSLAQLKQKDYKPKSVASMIGTDRLGAAIGDDAAAVTKEIRVPNGVVGFLIGRGGETIANLQAQSACKMQIQKEFEVQPGQTDRVITLSAATEEAIATCESRIMAMVEQRTREETQRNMPAGHTAVLQVAVPDSEVGLIIGKQGGECVIYVVGILAL